MVLSVAAMQVMSLNLMNCPSSTLLLSRPFSPLPSPGRSFFRLDLSCRLLRILLLLEERRVRLYFPHHLPIQLIDSASVTVTSFTISSRTMPLRVTCLKTSRLF